MQGKMDPFLSVITGIEEQCERGLSNLTDFFSGG